MLCTAAHLMSICSEMTAATGVQELTLHLKLEQGLSAEAFAMLLMSQAPTLSQADAASLPALDALNTLVAPCLSTLDIDVRLPPHQV